MQRTKVTSIRPSAHNQKQNYPPFLPQSLGNPATELREQEEEENPESETSFKMEAPKLTLN